MSNRRLLLRGITRSHRSFVTSLRRRQQQQQQLLQQLQQQHPLQQFTEEPRVNQLGIQYLSNDLHKKVFPTTSTKDYLSPQHPQLLEISKKHLQENELLGKKTQITEPITIKNFPSLVGKSMDEHFNKLGQKSSDPYLAMATNFLKKELPCKPPKSQWKFQSGWTRYTKDGNPPEQVPYPLEDTLVFDVEVMYKISNYPVMATCASNEAWYSWVSPALLDWEKQKNNSITTDQIDWNHLIPMNCAKKPKVIIGYNVSYDRARILEEYNIKQTKAFYLDGMSLHVATSGICSRQRPKWAKYNKVKKLSQEDVDEIEGTMEEEEEEEEEGEMSQELGQLSSESNDVSDYAKLLSDGFQVAVELEVAEDPWLLMGAPNSLANVARFHCNIHLDKTDRDYFATEDPNLVIDNFPKLMDYCAKDVDATFEVTKKLFPVFIQRIPHPVSFAALRHLGTLILPTTTKWPKYIEAAESLYESNRQEVATTLQQLANDLVAHIQNKKQVKPDYENDPWLSQLNWKLKETRLKKDGTPYKKTAYMTGYPEWYRELFKTSKGEEMNLTLKTRITPLLLRLKWEGHPLFWVDSQGWCFKVPFDDDNEIARLTEKKYVQPKLTEEELMETRDALLTKGKSYVLFKVPHPNGPSLRCTHILSKLYVRNFEDGTLTSEYDYATKILNLNNEASYWLGNRNRIKDQFVVYNQQGKNKFFDTIKKSKEHSSMGIIIPNLATMGTITRRATENTWLTASNAKKNRIGSELKSLVEAPKGYCFVGADVDSEELWIASLVGDSMLQIHGGTALGWMTLEGEKSQKTDLHSKTASILGISRNDAKVFNYGRIYGAGVKFATRLLKQFNANITDEEADKVARQLYDSTKGRTAVSKYLPLKIYYGGTESIMFNALEAIAQQEEPKTPVLGASITDALNVKNLNTNQYMTSRVNWTIQSSGVDYLHLLIISMEYLIEKYGIDARLAITVHDELRYLVKETDKYKAALLLQISNIWTRAMFCEQLGIKEVPQSCAFFSEVDIDHVLRKEVSMDCVTPSNPTPIPLGESLNIGQLLLKCQHGDILADKNTKPLTLRTTKYSPRQPIINQLDKNLTIAEKIAKIELQTSIDKDEWKKNLYNLAKVSRNKQNGKNNSTEKPQRVIKRKPIVEYDLQEDNNKKREIKYKKDPPKSKIATTTTTTTTKKASSNNSKTKSNVKVDESKSAMTILDLKTDQQRPTYNNRKIVYRKTSSKLNSIRKSTSGSTTTTIATPPSPPITTSNNRQPSFLQQQRHFKTSTRLESLVNKDYSSRPRNYYLISEQKLMVSTDLSNMMMESIESKRRRRRQRQQQRQQQSKIGDEDNFYD